MAKAIVLHKNTLLRIKKNLKKTASEITDNLIRNLSYIGEKAVTVARENGSYKDQTGNLRSSIGYVILMNGSPVINGETKQFNGAKGNGKKGVAAGKRLLKELQSKYSDGIVLIVCAGMKYAAYVEEIHNKDVLVSAEREAEKLAKKLLKHLTDG